jgi:hypothetical protein
MARKRCTVKRARKGLCHKKSTHKKGHCVKRARTGSHKCIKRSKR